jgi:hypothetical protein
MAKAIDIKVPIHTCACCGERGDITNEVLCIDMSLDKLVVLKVPQAEVDRVNNMDEMYRDIYGYYGGPIDGEKYFLLKHLEVVRGNNSTASSTMSIDLTNQDVFFPICIKKCLPQIKKKKPGQKYSIANHENYGDLRAIGIDVNLMSLATLMALSPVRLIQSVVGINQEKDALKKSGHCISFESDHLSVRDADLERIIKIGKGVDAGKSPKVLVPNTDISGSLSISFQGPQGEVEKIQRNIAGFATPAIVNAQHVVDTMKALMVVNPIMMENCYEDPSRDIPTLLENENQKICDSMLTDTRNHIQKLSNSNINTSSNANVIHQS